LHHVRNGTVSEPPPMPTMADTAPITPPTASMPDVPGKLRCEAGLAPKPICADMANTKRANTFCRAKLDKASATAAPNQAPTTMPGVSCQKTGHSTAPRR